MIDRQRPLLYGVVCCIGSRQVVPSRLDNLSGINPRKYVDPKEVRIKYKADNLY